MVLGGTTSPCLPPLAAVQVNFLVATGSPVMVVEWGNQLVPSGCWSASPKNSPHGKSWDRDAGCHNSLEDSGMLGMLQTRRARTPLNWQYLGSAPWFIRRCSKSCLRNRSHQSITERVEQQFGSSADLTYLADTKVKVPAMLRLILALTGLVHAWAQTGVPVVDLGQINRDFHAACKRGDTEAAAKLLTQGASFGKAGSSCSLWFWQTNLEAQQKHRFDG